MIKQENKKMILLVLKKNEKKLERKIPFKLGLLDLLWIVIGATHSLQNQKK